jgi:glyoxylase-like metal-dependent hydrolase (beta-lactamase superfamily II)
MVDIPFVRDLQFEYEVLDIVSPLIRRIVARNPGPYTAQGTGTYVVGRGHVAIIDPGPALASHVAAILAAMRGETIDHLLITHTHLDHSPASAAIQRATGAKTYGFGPHSKVKTGPSAEEGADRDFEPDLTLVDGERLTGDGWDLIAVHTPGHTSNHLCFALPQERVLFTGDHVMGWSTSVISPPDGDMAAYMASLELLLPRDDATYLPTHGPAITDPKRHVRAFIAHREARRDAILAAVAEGPKSIPEIVQTLYVGLAPSLHTAAGRSVLAHLIELEAAGKVGRDGLGDVAARYFSRRKN